MRRVIISASRRTDIPAYYSNWFYNIIQEGSVLIRNPFNRRQIYAIDLSPDKVLGIVFWTKNPLPMLARLDELRDYKYYFQFTITPYGKDIEPNIPDKKDVIIPAFKRLSEKIGADRVIWRYDPILINSRYSVDYHLRAFEKIAFELRARTRRVTISFIDTKYRGVKSNAKALALSRFSFDEQLGLSAKLAGIARRYGLAIDACAEPIVLQEAGIERSRCVDDRLLEKLVGRPLSLSKDRNQRADCGCVESVDIGMYNTCPNMCRYCYANYNPKLVAENHGIHDPQAPLISGVPREHDEIRERKTSRRQTQS